MVLMTRTQPCCRAGWTARYYSLWSQVLAAFFLLTGNPVSCAQHLRLMSEPSAAALAYADGILQAAPHPRHVLVRSCLLSLSHNK
jgi:hypothetical protein